MTYQITITFEIKTESDYKRYNKNIDNAIDLIVPYGGNYDIKETEYDNE